MIEMIPITNNLVSGFSVKEPKSKTVSNGGTLKSFNQGVGRVIRGDRVKMATLETLWMVDLREKIMEKKSMYWGTRRGLGQQKL